MNLVGQKVRHRKFGEGIIVREEQERFIYIRFEEGEKRLKYLESLRKHLVFADEDLQKEVEQILDEMPVSPVPPDPLPPSEPPYFPPYDSRFMNRDIKLNAQEVNDKYKVNVIEHRRGIYYENPDVIILVSSIAMNNDFWTKEKYYIYLGEGPLGDQELIRGNAAIENARYRHRKIYLLIKISQNEYYDQGEFELIDFREDQEQDSNGKLRRVYKFRLRKV